MKNQSIFAPLVAALALALFFGPLAWLVANCPAGCSIYLEALPADTATAPVDLSRVVVVGGALDVWESVGSFQVHEDLEGFVLAISGKVQTDGPWGTVQTVRYYRLGSWTCSSSAVAVLNNAGAAKVWIEDGVVTVIENSDMGAGADCRAP